jgi:5-oxoprolinase (ATP-hydrolysing) subunit A
MCGRLQVCGPVKFLIDLNADVGEGCSDDAALMTLISSANIACGVHAGDAATMRAAVLLARDAGVAIGAHPSFPDREHFGRREMHLSADDVHRCIVAQINALADIAAAAGAQLHHVKPHGALYNMAARDQQLAEAIAAAVHSVDPSLLLFGLAGSLLTDAATQRGLRSVNEAFADRAYRPDARLMPRDQPGGVLRDEQVVATRAVAIARDRGVTAVDGTWLQLDADTICLHGDTPGAALLADRIRRALTAAGIGVAAPQSPR